MSYTDNQPLESWLSSENEEAIIEPDLPIVDPHHHLWDLRQYDQQPFSSFQQKVYLCEEITNDIKHAGHNITHTVFAQCDAFNRADGPDNLKCVGETEFVNGIAAMSRSGLYGSTKLCAGIFSSADLRLGIGVEHVLLAHLGASANFRGIRTAFPSDLNSNFMSGFSILDKLGLSFDNYSPDFKRLPNLAKLADAYPDVPIIVNHLGGKVHSKMDKSEIDLWRQCIDAIAQSPNAVMKLGGAQQRMGNWQPEFHNEHRQVPIDSESLCDLLYPFYQYAINAFGPDRCMFESNFPVDKECVSYRTLWNMFKRIAATAGLSETEKTAVFSGTAKRVYRLS